MTQEALDLAAAQGANHVSVAERAREKLLLAFPSGFDVAIEASGAPEPFPQSGQILQQIASLLGCIYSWYDQAIQLFFQSLLLSEVVVARLEAVQVDVAQPLQPPFGPNSFSSDSFNFVG